MLNRIIYSVTFPTGKEFAASVDFSTGLTAVTGRNESGKSLLMEMVRFGLFGVKALRGKATDYKTLKLELEFELKGETYRVERTSSNAKLFRGGEQVATGTKPVNQRIIAVFGYGLEVFDVANACLQGEVERLGSMKPTERKALVDRTIGLDAIDTVSAQVSEELVGARAVVQSLEQDIVVPDAPEKPEGYAPADELRAQMKSISSTRDEITHLRAWLAANPEQTQPTKPADLEVKETEEELQSRCDQYDQDMDRLDAVTRKLNTITKPELSPEEISAEHDKIVAFQNWQADERLRASAPASAYDEAALYNIENAQKADEVRARIEKLREEDSHHCPSCGHEWSDHDEHIAELHREIPLYDEDKLPARYEFVDVRLERARNEAHAAMLAKLSGAKNPGEPAWTSAQLDRMGHQWGEYAKLDMLRKERRRLEMATLESPHARLIQLREYKRELSAYERSLDAWQKLEAERAANTARVAQLVESYPGDEAYEQLLPRLEAAVVYETRLQHYEEAKKAFETQEERLAEKREAVTDLERARTALRELKTKIKNHLLPSLNTVASALLARMTGGERSEIRVDEDFEILVDGQLLNTLSGSGKAVANLAIRLGLGQVLTNKTFSVFLADEIDAAMDADRAGYTAECLSNLTGSIAQIILVSHKTLSAQHHIEMGLTNVNQPPRAGDGRRRAS